MKAEDVPEELMEAAWQAWLGKHNVFSYSRLGAALDAVIPAIQNAALERAAVVADQYHNNSIHGPWSRMQTEIAAAIRALKEGT